MAESVLFLGVCLSLAAALLTNLQLYRFNQYLRINHPDLWEEHGFGNKRIGIAAKLMRLRRFATQFESDDPQLRSQFRMFRFLNALTVLSITVVLVGIILYVFPHR